VAALLKLKRSSTAGVTPSSLEAGELAINVKDKKLFSANSSGVFSIFDGDARELIVSESTLGAATTVVVAVSVYSNNVVDVSQADAKLNTTDFNAALANTNQRIINEFATIDGGTFDGDDLSANVSFLLGT
tara:strand:+ start:1258 stop:1650 length:393 start_codon:yes stop_codon:yes gene_type:complete